MPISRTTEASQFKPGDNCEISNPKTKCKLESSLIGTLRAETANCRSWSHTPMKTETWKGKNSQVSSNEKKKRRVTQEKQS